MTILRTWDAQPSISTMRVLDYVIFYTVFFVIYGLLNYYIFIRGWQALEYFSHLRIAYLVVFLILSLSFIAGRTLENFWLSITSEIFVWTGSFWLGAMLYFILSIVLLDLARLLQHFVAFLPSGITDNYAKAKFITACAVVGTVFITLLAGFVNAMAPRIRTFEVNTQKSALPLKKLSIAAVSDIHLGTIIGRSRFDRIAEMLNDIHADVILLVGDIVDEDLRPVIEENLGESLRALKARYGVFAITGNHEYIGGAEQAVAYMKEHGVTVLRDSVHIIEGGIQIVGREDRSMRQFAGRQRATLDELFSHVTPDKPVILLDHQPFELAEAARHGVDLQLSGHTHHGQLWPLNFITSLVYEISWGSLRLGQTFVYVSCGVGTWGPPVRLGNVPEILNITVTFSPRR